MCNEPQSNIHLKPLGILLMPYGMANKQCFVSVLVKRLTDPFIKLNYYIN